jgi:hypothetical protein
MHSPLPTGHAPVPDTADRGSAAPATSAPLPTYRIPGAPERTHLTVAETAARLGVSVRVIHLRIKAGLLPATKLPGVTSPYLIDSAVVEYMAIQEADRRARREEHARRRAARAASAAA